jgi:choline dehydrogenase-like flavoprotein
MLVDFDAVSESPQLSTDFCIVGGGAAGITLAMELIPTGKQILLLEGGGMDYGEASQSLYEMDVVSPRYQSPATSRLRFLGGTTNHWTGSVRSFDPIDFEKRSWVPDSGWPFSYEELSPYYDRAFAYIDAGPRYKDERPFTLHLGQFSSKFAAAGFIPSIGYRSPPTRFGKKYLEQLRSAPNLTVMINANLLSINEEADRSAVKSLTVCNYKRQTATVNARYYVIALGGIENARALLLSDAVTPGGIGNEYGVVGRYFMDHPVIKAMVFYPSSDFVNAWHGGRVRYQSTVYGISFSATDSLLRQHQLTNARMPLDWASEAETSAGIEAAHQVEKGVTSGIWLPNVLSHLRNILNDGDVIYEQWRRKRGLEPAKSRADAYGGYLVEMMMEQRPDPDNRIVLTEEHDHLGLRKGKVFWRVPQQEKDDFNRLINLFAKGVGAEGVGFVRSFLAEDDTGRRFHELLNFGSHHMGSTRASTDPKKGVVDADQRVHGRSNIYIAGSSIFPTGGHVPPTATIVATTIRLADHLRKRLV